MADNQIENNVHDQKIFQHYLKVHNKSEDLLWYSLIFSQNLNPLHSQSRHNPTDRHHLYHPKHQAD